MAWKPSDRVESSQTQYIVHSILGRGSFGMTYRVEDLSTGKEFALKTLSEQLLQSPDRDRFEERFFEEASRLRQCNNPHIVNVEAIFKEKQTQRWCMTMEYIDGQNLAEIAKNRLPMPESEALHFIRQIGEALIEVHRHQTVHRDVKPRNIMLRSGKSEAILIDFGLIQKFDHPLTIAKPAPDAAGFAPLEMYLSTRTCGPYTDIYALAATLYYLLTGQTPPNALDRRDNNIAIEPQKQNPEISDATGEAIITAMELEPDRRPDMMQEWLDSLPQNETKEVWENTQKTERDWTKIGIIIALATLLVTILAALPAWFPYFPKKTPTQQSSPPTQETEP